MKNILPFLLASALCSLLVPTHSARAQGTGFTYQSVLNQGGVPANGAHDLTFTLYTAASGGGTVGTSNVFNDLLITNGLFTVTLDFGASAFIGANRWLQIAVRPGASTGAYTNLVPRQPVTATPYALFAAGANASTLIGSIPSSALSGTYSVAVTLNNAANQFTGIGSNLTALNASQLTGGAVPAAALSNAWKLGGNTGANPTNGNFLGTTDNQALEFKVNGQRALRLQGGNTTGTDTPNLIGGSPANTISSGVIGSVISGGGYTASNSIIGSAANATIGGGKNNVASGNDAFIGGGANNQAAAAAATVGGGNGNIASGGFATIPGGFANTASAGYSFAAGRQAKATNNGAFVWSDSTGVDFASTANDQFLIRATGGVAIGTNNPAGAALRVAGSIKADSFLGMGATLMLGTTDNQPLEFKVNNERGLRLEYPTVGTVPNLIGGYSGNTVGAGTHGAVIAGGGVSTLANKIGVNADFSAIGGGYGNNIASNSFAAAIAGGQLNDIGAGSDFSAIGGGRDNNIADGSFNATIAGGDFNDIGMNASYSAIGGGLDNNIASDAQGAVIPGGRENDVGAGAFCALAAGRRAQANHPGAFVWADFTGADFASTASNQFLIRAAGGVGIGTTAPDRPLTIQGTGGNSEWLSLKNSSGATKWHLNHFNGGLNFTETGVADHRLFLRAGGNVGIGINNPSHTLTVQNTSNEETMRLIGPDAVGSGARLNFGDGDFVYLDEPFDDGLTIQANEMGIGGDPTDGGARLQVFGSAFKNDGNAFWAISSDRRLKQDIVPYAKGLAEIARLETVRFHYKDDPKLGLSSQKEQIGLIAQDAREVFPEAVEEGTDGYLHLNINAIQWASLNAIQELAVKQRELRAGQDKQIGELQAQNAVLRERQDRLASDNAELKRRLDTLERLLTEDGGAR